MWLFDLDNTLHDASFQVFGHIDRRMTQAIMHFLGLPQAQADALRRLYWARYGATMIGLHRHHGVSSADFLAYSHDFDVLASVQHRPWLRNWLKRLPGVKYVLTNAPSHYAQQVLQALGVADQFIGMCAIEQMQWWGRFRPKPALSLFQALLAELGQTAGQVILVEDTLKNLKAAKSLGMRTVWVRHEGTPFNGAGKAGRPSYVDWQCQHLWQLRWPLL